jgi:hypothetical protein
MRPSLRRAKATELRLAALYRGATLCTSVMIDDVAQINDETRADAIPNIR